MINILTERVIRTSLHGGDTPKLRLPEVYEALASDVVEGFPAVQRHQQHAWHAFLAQLGTIATEKRNRGEPPIAAAEWLQNLQALTEGNGGDEAWELVVDNEQKPAFLQPPAPNGLTEYRRRVRCPDTLDVLVTANITTSNRTSPVRRAPTTG